MKSKLLVMMIISLIFSTAYSLANDDTEFRLESKSVFEDKGGETRIVNHRFSTVIIGDYPGKIVLDERFEVSYFTGIEGSRADLTVKAYSLHPNNKGALLYTITDNADIGESVEIVGSSFYFTTKYGCCGAEDYHGLFRLDNGKLLLTYSGKYASVKIANTGYGRIAAYHSNQSCIEPAGYKQASGILTFATPEYVVVQMKFYVRNMPEWTPNIEFIDNFTGNSSEELELISVSPKKQRSYYESGISLKLQFEEGDPVLIPIINGEIDIKNIKCPENISYEVLPNKVLSTAKLLNEEGYKLYKLKKDKEAIEKYKKAINLIEDPLFYYNYGNSLSNIDKYEEAIEAYLKAMRLGYFPSYLVLYNIACAYSRLGNIKESYDYLHLAIENGYKSFKYIETDSDLENLRKDKNWKSWFEKERSKKSIWENIEE